MYELYYRLVSLSLLSWFWQKSKSDSSENWGPQATARSQLFPTYIPDHLRLVSLKFNCKDAILESLQECWNLGNTLKQRFAVGAHSCRLRKNWFCSALLLKDFRKSEIYHYRQAKEHLSQRAKNSTQNLVWVLSNVDICRAYKWQAMTLHGNNRNKFHNLNDYTH